MTYHSIQAGVEAGELLAWDEYLRPPNMHMSNSPEKYSSPHLLRMIRVRLHLEDGASMPFPFIAAHKVDETSAVVFIVTNGTPQMLTDNLDLFPSDILMTQLRLLRSDK